MTGTGHRPAPPYAPSKKRRLDAFREAWRGILAVDYRPVFETGRTALAALSAEPDTGQAVAGLADSGSASIGTNYRTCDMIC